MFTPISTERLVIRAFEPDDVGAMYLRRNEPEVSRFQSWALPYPLERVQQLADEVAALDGPTNDEWWTATVAGAASDEVLGDVVVHLTNDRRTAEIGYTLASAHWGRGYAVEAVTALVAYLFDEFPVSRICGLIHPDNTASAMVLERTGLLYEGRTRLSYWVDDDNSDDAIYGMTRADWEEWRNRPRTTAIDLQLVEITPEVAAAVRALRTHESQVRFVAPVVNSFADALVPPFVTGAPVVPWLRAVAADGELVGFVMLTLRTEHHPEPFLWRLLIDRLHQRRGVASRVLHLVEAECVAWGARSLLTRWIQGRGSPEPFALARGFVPTGNLIDDGTGIEARKELAPPEP